MNDKLRNAIVELLDAVDDTEPLNSEEWAEYLWGCADTVRNELSDSECAANNLPWISYFAGKR